jgi:hypothetical protein
MTEINYFKKFTFFCGDMAIIKQLRYIARMSREVIHTDLFI